MLRLLGLKTIFHKVLGPFGALGMMIRLMDKILHYLRTLNYGNYGIFLIIGHAGFCPSAVWPMAPLGFGVFFPHAGFETEPESESGLYFGLGFRV